jgi:succinoglycan biosynthesis transport protein ExoP
VAEREDNLQRSIKRVEAANTGKGELSVHLGELERRSEATKKLYDALLQRYQETKQQGDLVTADARVVSRAAPPSLNYSPR